MRLISVSAGASRISRVALRQSSGQEDEEEKRTEDNEEDKSASITWKVKKKKTSPGKNPLFYHKMTKLAITNVHHRKPCVTAQVALKTAGLHSCVEDLHSVVWEKQIKINSSDTRTL